MAKLRGVSVTKADTKTEDVWAFSVQGVRWDFRLNPSRNCWRKGVAVLTATAHLACPDDAILFALGYEAGRLAGLLEERGAL